MQRWKLDNVKSTQEFTHVKFYFYVRFQFFRTLTCVDKNATVEIHLNTALSQDFKLVVDGSFFGS